jgi:hypothetical protein
MTTTIDLRSIAFDLNSFPTVGAQGSSPTPVELERTDYSQLLRKLAGINALSFTCSIICLVFDLIFTLIVLGIGASNQSSCPIEPRIPIYLIVYGSINLVSLCFSFLACIIHHRNKGRNVIGFYYVHCSAMIIIFLQLFNFIWLIIGSIWVFSIFNDVQYTNVNETTTYCQQNIYQFTVVAIILQYVLPIVLCCCKNIPFYF